MGRLGQFKDLIGIRFGKLVVQHLHHSQPKGKINQVVRYWFCLCDCGGTVVIRGSHLNDRANITRSCGCERLKYQHGDKWKERSIRPGTAFRLALSRYKQNAKHRSLSWELTDEQFRELTSLPCYYTGKLPATVSKAKSGEVYVHNGIDRVDNTKGYFIENCVPCCQEINMMKMNLTKENFIELCNKVAERCK